MHSAFQPSRSWSYGTSQEDYADAEIFYKKPHSRQEYYSKKKCYQKAYRQDNTKIDYHKRQRESKKGDKAQLLYKRNSWTAIKTFCNAEGDKEAGSSFEKAVKTTCFLADMGDFAKFNEVYARYFVNKPARSCVAVKTLPKNVLCEVEVIAEV